MEKLPENPITMEECQALMNEFTALRDQMLAFADRLRGRSSVDQRWLAIGVTDVEKGCMSIAHAFALVPLKEAQAELERLMKG